MEMHDRYDEQRVTTELVNDTSPFALSIANIVNFKLPVERRPQPQPTQDLLL